MKIADLIPEEWTLIHASTTPYYIETTAKIRVHIGFAVSPPRNGIDLGSAVLPTKTWFILPSGYALWIWRVADKTTDSAT